MEFDHIGKHCQLEECGTLDFLEFKCYNCKKDFCLDHRLPHNHQCSNYNHKKVEPETNEKVRKDTCNIKSCKYSKMVLVDCDNCKNLFCLSHRNERDHRCKGKKDHGAVRFSFIQVVCKGQENQFLPLLENQKHDYQTLIKRISVLFKLDNFTIKYIDEEKDFISIISDEDLKFAFNWSQSQKNQHLTVVVFPKNTNCSTQASSRYKNIGTNLKKISV